MTFLEQKSVDMTRPDKLKLIHLDLKGAPPKLLYYRELFPTLQKIGATGILIEYEDMFPYCDDLLDIAVGYSVDNICEIQQLAKDHNLTVIPLVQTIGHMEFVLKYLKFSHLREVSRYPNSLCPTHPESVNLVLEMVRQILALHPESHWIHLGADEVWQLGMCERCNKVITAEKGNRNTLFLKYIATLTIKIKSEFPHISLIIWDDMLRNIEPSIIRESGIGDLLEVMVWHYQPQEAFSLKEDLLETYASIFNHIWAASAFKGAADIVQIVPPVRKYISNQLAWIQTLKNNAIHLQKTNFRGIAITGWQRFDHFTGLCELLPVSLPSLALCLQTILDGNFTDETHHNASMKLGFIEPIPLIEYPSDRSITTPTSFPGVRIYVQINILNNSINDFQLLLQHPSFKGGFSEYQLYASKTNPLHIDQFLLKAKSLYNEMETIASLLLPSMTEYFDSNTTEELFTNSIYPQINKLRDLIQKAEDQLGRKNLTPLSVN